VGDLSISRKGPTGTLPGDSRTIRTMQTGPWIPSPAIKSGTPGAEAYSPAPAGRQLPRGAAGRAVRPSASPRCACARPARPRTPSTPP
jgi:hypothetical protein